MQACDAGHSRPVQLHFDYLAILLRAADAPLIFGGVTVSVSHHGCSCSSLVASRDAQQVRALLFSNLTNVWTSF